MNNNFELWPEGVEDPDHHFLTELDMDYGRLRTDKSKARRQVTFYLARSFELFGRKLNYFWSDRMYRHYWKLRYKGTDEVYILYTCYFVWRIGGTNDSKHLGELMELLNPEFYAGYSKKSIQEILDGRQQKIDAEYGFKGSSTCPMRSNA